MYFLNGGKACLMVIGDYLRGHGIGRVLLPAYLCPSIVDAFEACGLDCDFYRVHTDLSIDLQDLAVKCEGVKVMYFINYFGFYQPPQVMSFLKKLQEGGILLIEDNAQGGFHGMTSGDFILNSMRKLVPYDGGYLITQHDMTPYIQMYQGIPNRRLPVIRGYRAGLYRYLFRGKGSHKRLEEMFRQAELYYESDPVVEGDSQEREHIERLDWHKIKKVRRENYNTLLKRIEGIEEISTVFPVLQEGILPLGLPVYFSGALRDRVNEEMGKHGIGLTVHWEEIQTHPRTCRNQEAADMAGRMLTLAIDQRTSREQMDYMVEHLAAGIEAAKKTEGEGKKIERG